MPRIVSGGGRQGIRSGLQRIRLQLCSRPNILQMSPMSSLIEPNANSGQSSNTIQNGRTSDGVVFVTTPIFYVNAAPHIGHAYTALVADAIARWHRVRGDKVLFASGTDEHGNKVADAAKLKGMQSQEFCDDVSGTFRSMIDELDISVDDFVRTTEDRHRNTVEWLWQRLVDRGHIHLGQHHGWYCRSDEAFVPETSVVSDGKGGKMSVEDGKAVEWLSEPNYKFKLGSMREGVEKVRVGACVFERVNVCLNERTHE
jgi:methionyl-tRNA synthetase